MQLDKERAIELSMKYIDDGFLCVGAVLKTLAEMKSIESEYIPSIATGLGAGVARTSQICGAVSGAILGLGLWFGRNEPISSETRPYWYSRYFIDRWLDTHPDSTCTGLLGVDIDTEEGINKFNENDYWVNKCQVYVRDAVALAVDIINSNT
jgi:C_GCAxxG_C_C family probable redox protein